MTHERTLHVQVAWACRILAKWGQADLTLGHVSARGEDDNICYMKRKGLGLDEITPDDVLSIDLEGNKLSGSGKMHLEAVLHTEVYKARSDVRAVIHTHPPYATALGATNAKLEMVNHDAVLFQDGLNIFEDTAEIITDAAQGKAVAQTLASHRAVLMRNHGVLVVGRSVPWAVYTALTLERAAQIQQLASTSGELEPISRAMAKQMHDAKFREGFVEEYWDYLIRDLRRAGLDSGMPAT